MSLGGNNINKTRRGRSQKIGVFRVGEDTNTNFKGFDGTSEKENQNKCAGKMFFGENWVWKLPSI